MKRAIWLLAAAMLIVLLVVAMGSQANDASAQVAMGAALENGDSTSVADGQCGQLEPLWAPERQDFSGSLESQDFSEILGWISVASGGPFALPDYGSEGYYNTFHSANIDGDDDGVDELLGRGEYGMEAYRFDSGTNSWYLVAGSGPFSPPDYNSAGYYNTIHSGDIDGDGADELLGRGADGMEAYRFDALSNEWEGIPMPLGGPFKLPDYGSENYFNTIHSADIDGDGTDELLGRGEYGMEAYHFDTETNIWQLVAGSGPFPLPDYNSAGYYNTIHSGDIDGDGADELLGRGAYGMEAYDFDKESNEWHGIPMPEGGPFKLPDYGTENYFNTFHSADIDGDGTDELLGRGGYGMQAYHFDVETNKWQLVAGIGAFPLPAYNTAGYYNTIHSGDIDGDGADELLGRGGFGMEAYRFGPIRELTVLTYNTHLFGGSVACEWFPTSPCFDDVDRRNEILERIKDSGADIVALEEVWEGHSDWQNWFRDQLESYYPYSWHYNECEPETNLIGSGLVLLSKWPWEEGTLGYTRFPVYYSCGIGSDCDWHATKGAYSITALVGNPPAKIRVAISHGLTGKGPAFHEDFRKSEWGPNFNYYAITPFQLDGQPYLFSKLSDRNEALITRIEDYGCDEGLDEGYPACGAGTKHLYFADWSYSSIAGDDTSMKMAAPGNFTADGNLDLVTNDQIKVESFQLDGHPYIFAIAPTNQATIMRINDDPSTGWQHIYADYWQSNDLPTLAAFQLNDHPYIFSLKPDNGMIITRINDDPSTGWQHVHTGYWDSNYKFVRPFTLNDHTYLIAMEEGNDQARIVRIDADQDGNISLTNEAYFTWRRDLNLNTLSTFELNGKPHIFASKLYWVLNPPPDDADIMRINSEPQDGVVDVTRYPIGWQYNENSFIAVKPFEMNGEPHLWALRNCCAGGDYYCKNRPGELMIAKVYQDENGKPNILYDHQLEFAKKIRDATVHDDKPAIMMGDFNIDSRLYGIMDELFAKEGAIDAYIAVHGSSGDGKLDLVAGNWGWMNRQYPNTGPTKPFDLVGGAAIDYWDTDRTKSLALGDVDGDGDLDLVAGNYEQANKLYLNQGTGGGLSWTWGDDTILTDTHKTTSVALGDVNGDGYLDLVVGNDGQPNQLYLSNGDPDDLFGGVTGRDISTDSHKTSSLALGDIDGDGDLDLVVGNDGQPNRVYLNNGDPYDPFGGVIGRDISSDNDKTNSVALGDIDRDGDLDLVAGNWDQANRLYLNNGSLDPFGNVSGQEVSQDANQTLSIALGDVDGDGFLDLVAGNWEQRNRLYLNSGDPSDPFGGVVGRDIGIDSDPTRSVALGDVNEDWDLDLVAGNDGQPNRLYLNNGDPSDPFGGVAGSNISDDSDSTNSVLLADVDGGETNDQRNNKLSQVFDDSYADCSGWPQCLGRIDYVYVNPSGGGISLVPTDATVLHDWKYDIILPPPLETIHGMDLSDHYPLKVTFRIEAAKKLTYLPLIISP